MADDRRFNADGGAPSVFAAGTTPEAIDGAITAVSVSWRHNESEFSVVSLGWWWLVAPGNPEPAIKDRI